MLTLVSRYDAQLDAALQELQLWCSRPQPNDTTSANTYEVIAERLRDMRQQEDIESLYDSLESLNRFICDQGPLSREFVPSFKALFLQLHDERHHRI
jgi:hypothetical protein